MKVEKFPSTERDILTSLIVNEQVLSKVHQQMNGDRFLFPSRWSNLIARWCLDHFTKYHTAPKQSIQNVFSEWARTAKDKEAVELIEDLLSSLSGDYKSRAKDFQSNDYWIDRVSKYVGEAQLAKNIKDQQDAIDRGDLDEALKIREGFKKIDFSSKTLGNFVKREEVKETYTYLSEDRSLLKFPKALGEFLNEGFTRENFIAFVGADKSGKSYWLLEVLWQAVKQRHKVS